MNIMENWNRAWDQSTIYLVPTPKHFRDRVLEGANTFDRRVVRQFIHKDRICTEEEYDKLVNGVGEFGYCVEAPATFKFVG